MTPFHDNKLNTVSLDDSDEEAYTPTRNFAKGRKTLQTSNATVEVSSKKNTNPLGMGCLPSKRKREAGDVGTLFQGYRGYHNRSTDSGMENMPMEPISRPPSSESSMPSFDLDSIRPLVDRDTSPTHNAEYERFDQNAIALSNAIGERFESLGRQNRPRLNDHDLDRHVPSTYPMPPRNDAFVDRDTVGAVNQPTGNHYDSSSNLGREQGTFQGQSSFENNGFGHRPSSHVGIFNDHSMYVDSSRAHASASELYNYTHGSLHGGTEDGSYAVDGGMTVAVKEENDQSDQIDATTPTKTMLQKKKPTRWEGFPHKFNRVSRQQQRVRTGNAIMINENPSGDVDQCSGTFDYADQYDDCIMDDVNSSFDPAMNHGIPTPRAHDNSNDMTVFSAIPNATDPHLLGDYGLLTNVPPPLSGYTPAQSTPSGHAQVDPNTGTNGSMDGSAHGHYNSVTVQHDPRHVAGMFLDGSLVSPTRRMPSNYDLGCDFFSTDPRMRYRNIAVFDNRSISTTAPQFIVPGTLMPPSPISTQSQASRTQSGATSVYGMTDNTGHGTMPAAPASSSTYSNAYSMPVNGTMTTTPASNSAYSNAFAMPVNGPAPTAPVSSATYGNAFAMPVNGSTATTPASSSIYSNTFGMPVNGTTSTTPASSPAHSDAIGMPVNGYFHGATDNTQATGGTFDRVQHAYVNQNSMPVTPPRSAAADSIVADRLDSNLREDGAFNPQGNRESVYSTTWVGLSDQDDWPLYARQNNHSMDDGEDDSKGDLEDPFVDFSTRN